MRIDPTRVFPEIMRAIRALKARGHTVPTGWLSPDFSNLDFEVVGADWRVSAGSIHICTVPLHRVRTVSLRRVMDLAEAEADDTVGPALAKGDWRIDAPQGEDVVHVTVAGVPWRQFHRSLCVVGWPSN